MLIILSLDYYLFDQLFSLRPFQSGESHVVAKYLPENTKHIVVEASARTFTDIGHVVVANLILKQHGIKTRWFLPYFPYCRTSIKTGETDGNELEVALRWIQAELDVLIADPHSEASTILPHIKQKTVVDFFKNKGLFDDDPLIAVPDAGAAKKVQTWSENRDVVLADKQRTPTTGNVIQSLSVSSNLGKRSCVVVDDICDSGQTASELAKCLREVGSGKLTLVVTHGLFIQNNVKIETFFDRIFSFDIKTGPNPIRPEYTGAQSYPFKELYQYFTNSSCK